ARCPIERRPLTVSSTWFWPPLQVRAVSTCKENMIGFGVPGSGFRVLVLVLVRVLVRTRTRTRTLNPEPGTLNPFELAELRELEEHVIRVHPRDREAYRAVAESAAHDVVAQEREERMDGEVDGRGAAAGFVHLARRERRVAVDRLQVIGDVAVGVVLQLAPQPADFAAHGHCFVDVRSGPLRRPPVVEAQLVVRVPV